MFYKFGIVLFAAFVCRTSALAPCVCARIYKPVCGSDNHTYGNQCRFDCAQYTDRSLNLTVAHKGPCEGQGLQICICDYEDKPVCGTDGVTYPHECALECQQRRDPVAHLTIQHKGACVQEHFCECTEELNLVCGSDGKTYANPCLLECKANQTSGLTKQHDGSCDQVKVAEVTAPPTCTCTRNMEPVCGTDGVTYDNPCLLECAAQNKHLQKKSDGACNDSDTVKVADVTVPRACTCTRNLNPVCGTDGVTYSNPCLLECAALNKSLAKKSDGPCNALDTVKLVEPTNCLCTREDVPVCGSNGQTYANQCLLECAAKSNPDLTLLHADSC